MFGFLIGLLPFLLVGGLIADSDSDDNGGSGVPPAEDDADPVQLTGQKGISDDLTGTDGNDTLTGNAEEGDRLDGGDGDDILNLAAGNTGTGGDGADLFNIFPEAGGDSPQEDGPTITITDFDPSEDRIGLESEFNAPGLVGAEVLEDGSGVRVFNSDTDETLAVLDGLDPETGDQLTLEIDSQTPGGDPTVSQIGIAGISQGGSSPEGDEDEAAGRVDPDLAAFLAPPADTDAEPGADLTDFTQGVDQLVVQHAAETPEDAISQFSMEYDEEEGVTTVQLGGEDVATVPVPPEELTVVFTHDGGDDADAGPQPYYGLDGGLLSNSEEEGEEIAAAADIVVVTTGLAINHND